MGNYINGDKYKISSLFWTYFKSYLMLKALENNLYSGSRSICHKSEIT